MKALLSLAAILLLAGCGAQSPRIPKAIKLDANPSAVVAQDTAYNQMISAKSLREAHRAFAAKDNVVFMPDPKNAFVLTEAEMNELSGLKLQTHQVYMSCDGKTGVATGAWQLPQGRQGYYTTVWQWFERRDGSGKWLWVLDHGNPLKTPRKAPEFIGSKIASCKGNAPTSISAPAEGDRMKQSLSRDQSLSYSWVYRPDKSRVIEVKLWNGTAMETVLKDEIGPQ